MLARGTLCRLVAEVPKQATHDLPKLASIVQTARSGYSLPIRTLSHVYQLQTRLYVTNQAATQPTETVKKAVKAKAAAGKSVKNTTTTKEAGSKKVASKKAKKKAAPKKPAKKSVPKKELTPEEKEKESIRKLRKLALKEPVSRYPVSAFNLFIAEGLKGKGKGAVEELSSQSSDWKNITPAEHERYNHLAAERNEARLAEYKAWIESHTPDEIRIANNARNQLRRKLAHTTKGKTAPAYTKPLVDERHVKRPRTAWATFLGERTQSTDFNGIAVTERIKLVAAEWKALNADEKKRYEDEAAADKQRYVRERSALSSSSA